MEILISEHFKAAPDLGGPKSPGPRASAKEGPLPCSCVQRYVLNMRANSSFLIARKVCL